MKHFILACLYTVSLSTVFAIEPDWKDVSYGPHERQRYDVYLPSDTESDPRALVMLIHGGGFTAGSKDSYRNNPITEVLTDLGYAVAATNYRYMDPLHGIFQSLEDCRYAVQHIRYTFAGIGYGGSGEMPVILWGSSAGAGASLWIGLQDDVAQTYHEDPVQRFSTAVSGIIAYSTQATYDLFLWPDILGLDMQVDINSTDLSLMGLHSDSSEEQIRRARDQLNLLAFIDSEDPPVLIRNANVQPGDILHAPTHAVKLSQVLGEAGVSVFVNAEGTAYHTEYSPYEFIEFCLIGNNTDSD